MGLATLRSGEPGAPCFPGEPTGDLGVVSLPDEATGDLDVPGDFGEPTGDFSLLSMAGNGGQRLLE